MKQFSIRDVLFLFVIIALVLGWWLDRRPIPARFQIRATSNHAYALDTATGQVWEQSIGENGVAFGNTGSFLQQKLPSK